jgi:hypothetical protein
MGGCEIKKGEKKMYKIEIYMKSGNVIKFKCKDLNLEYKGENVTHMTWKNGDDVLMFTDITQIEAIMKRR